MPKRYRAKLTFVHFIIAGGGLLMLAFFLHVFLAPPLPSNWFDNALNILSLFAPLTFCILPVFIPLKSSIEISDEGILYKTPIRTMIAKWQDVDYIKNPRYGSTHIFFTKVEEVWGISLLVDLIFESADNLIPISAFLSDWRKELAPYIRKYSIPIQS